jgi:indole-3-acetate monooxygenase
MKVEAQGVTARPAASGASALEIARALAARIRERATEIEAARQLPPDLVLDIANAGLLKVAVAKPPLEAR